MNGPAEDTLLAVWRRHGDILQYLIAQIEPEGLAGTAASKGRSVGAMLAHLHNARRMWIEAAAPELVADVAKLPKEAAGDRALLAESLAASGRAVEALLARERVRGFPAGPAAFAGYLVAHEWYHVGELGLALKQSGHQLPDKVSYGLWDRWGKADSGG